MASNEKHIHLITGYLQGTLTAEQREQFDRLAASGEIDLAEVRELEAHFNGLERIPVPQPDPAMEQRFQAMLQREKEALGHEKGVLREEKTVVQADQENQDNETAGRTSRLRFLPGLFTADGASRIRHLQSAAAIAAVFLAGLLLGLLFADRGTNDMQVRQLAAEVHDLRETMMISLLDDVSASERLRAVNISMDIASPQDRVIDALVQTLRHDPSVNVRVAAVEALVRHGAHPAVRQELVRAITRQPSPIVQIALADAMIALQEPGAIREFQLLLEQDEVEEPVRDKIEQTMLVLL